MIPNEAMTMMQPEMHMAIGEIAKGAPWGAIAAIGQYGYSVWKKRSREQKRTETETRIVTLNALITSLGDAECEELLGRLRREREDAIQTLGELLREEDNRKLHPHRHREWADRWLLLAPARNRTAIVWRVCFFIALAIACGPVVRTLRGVNMMTPPQIALWFVAAVLIAEVFRRAALRADKQPARG